MLVEHVGGDLGVPLLDPAHAVGSEIGADEGDHQRHHAGGVEERAEQPERREAGGVHHDDFGIGRELVQRVRDRDHQRDRRDDQDQRRNDQAGDAEEGQDGLTLARHQVDAAQRLGNPDHAGEADQDHRKRRQASCGKYTCRSTPSLTARSPPRAQTRGFATNP